MSSKKAENANKTPLPVAAIAVAALSGFAALQYEILWSRRLHTIFGGTTGVTAYVMAWLFVGLCIGSWALGPGADRSRNPWRRFAYIEFGIFLLVLPTVWLDTLAMPFGVAENMNLSGAWRDLTAFAGAGLVVAPPAALMGATLPSLAAALGTTARLGRHGAILYGANTVAGAVGAVWASFVMLPAVGMYGSFAFALLCGISAGIIALAKGSGNGSSKEAFSQVTQNPTAKRSNTGKNSIFVVQLIVAAISGFGILGTETLLLVAFSQVFRSATFSMASIIATVVLLLGFASFAAPRIARSSIRLPHILSLAGLAASTIPPLFLQKTMFLSQSAGLNEAGLARYAWTLIATSVFSAGFFFAVAGLVFPLLFGENETEGKAKQWSYLLAANAIGAVAGGLAARWILLPRVGLWGAFGIIGLVYVCGAIAYFFLVQIRAHERIRRPAWPGYAFAATLILAVGASAVLIGADLPILSVRQGDRLLALEQAPDGIVSVVSERDGNQTIRINNYYWLGGTLGADDIRRMGILPLLFHPAPKDVAHIGTGTGITAGAVLSDPGVEQLVSLELSQTVIEMAEEFFAPHANGLFTDPRADVVAADARTFLRASEKKLDVVIGDLFTPWSTGVSASFSREHFRTVRRSLSTGGVFVQWLPAYQLDEPTLEVIAATFAGVFPDAVAILCSHSPSAPRIGLVGIRDREMDFETLMRRCDMAAIQEWTNDPSLVDPFSVASLIIGGVEQLGRDAETINTLNNAWVEFNTPVGDIAPDSVFLSDNTVVNYMRRVTHSTEASQNALRFLSGGPAQLAQAPIAAFRFLRENHSKYNAQDERF